MGEIIHNVHVKIKDGSSSLFLFVLRLFVGTGLGITFTIILQEILQYGRFAYWFVAIASLLVFLRVSKGWKFTGILIFLVLAILAGSLLRMYIMVAPGA